MKLRLYCRNCRKLVDGLEGWVEPRVIPEANPKFDIIFLTCPECHRPILEVSRPSRR